MDDATTRGLLEHAEGGRCTPATVDFTIKLPHGMIHGPTSEPERGHSYGVWKESGLLNPSVPSAFVRLAPYGAKTLDDLARDATYGAELVAKEILPDETLPVSLHPRVLEPLARQIVAAAKRSQVIVVSHAAALVDAVSSARDAVRIELAKEDGQTIVAGRNRLDEPVWKWTP